ncbi:MAG: hypothetical protein WCB12_05855, partial [Bryobacteraceae bacterium]
PTAPATTVYSPENEQENPAKGARHCANQISALQAHSWIRKCCIPTGVINTSLGARNLQFALKFHF